MKIFTRIWELLAALGIYTTIMFAMGYLYASLPVHRERTCTPDLIDRILK